MSDLDLQTQLLTCQTRNAELQNAVRVLIAGRDRRDAWGNILAETLIALMREQPEYQAQFWLNQFAILAREIVAQGTEIQALQTQVSYFQEKAGTDELTGLSNRRAFDDFFRRELATLARNIPPPPSDVNERRQLPVVSFMVIDVDHFKQINDTYGHPAGDVVLIEVAQRIARSFDHRSSDIVARCGGEEFWVTWPAVNREKALEKAHEFCQYMAAAPIQIRDQQGNIVPLTVTVSIGISTIEVTERLQPDTALQELNAAADQALYQAKQRGRNRAIHAQLPEKE